jgi:hypothetical protein
MTDQCVVVYRTAQMSWNLYQDCALRRVSASDINVEEDSDIPEEEDPLAVT